MRSAYCIAVLGFATILAGSASAQIEDELRQQLEAQKAINEQLRKRVEELERQLDAAPLPALQASEPRPVLLELEIPEATTALQEALVAKGLVLLPPGSFRLSPSFTWGHSGANALRTQRDSYTASLIVQAGLPAGMQLSASLPYTYRRTSIGSNSGVDDLFVSLSKSLTKESESMPALVASLGYLHDNGKDPFGTIPIGFGFRVLRAEMSAFKSREPLALYTSVAYSHPYARSVSADNLFNESRFSGRIAPGDSWSYRLGTSLAATPEITLDASVSGSFVGSGDVRSDARGSFKRPKSTLGFFNLGAGFLLSKELTLLASASAGVTKDSPDLTFSVSLPYRF